MNETDCLEKKFHALDGKLKTIEEERNYLANDNDILQDQLSDIVSIMAKSEGKVIDFKHEFLEISEDVRRIHLICSSQQDQLSVLSDKFIHLSGIQEQVKQIFYEINTVKDDFIKIQTENSANNVSRLSGLKDLLYSHERVFEDRLNNLESIILEISQRDDQFFRLVEETNYIKDQVDSLRELSANFMNTSKANHISLSCYSYEFPSTETSLQHELYLSESQQKTYINEDLVEVKTVSENPEKTLSLPESSPITYASDITTVEYKTPEKPSCKQNEEPKNFGLIMSLKILCYFRHISNGFLRIWALLFD